MHDIQYSLDALNAISKFHRAKIMVYVEGEDDVIFWEQIFNKLSTLQVALQDVGSSTELDNYINKITDGSLNAIAARDSDYLDFTETKQVHPRVVYTWGHSIENTLFTASCVYELCKVSLRKNGVTYNQCEEWLKEFSSKLDRLLMLEIANELEGTGVEILGTNCSRFMINNDSDIICDTKTKAHAKKVSEKLNQQSIHKASSMMPTNNENILRWLRGHILESGIQKFITNRLKEYGRKSNYSYEQLFTNAIHQFQSSLIQNHPHLDHYKCSIESLENSLT